MKASVFLKKVVLRFEQYADRLAVTILRLPRLLLARPIVSLIGPLVLISKAPSTLASRDKPHVLILRNKYHSSRPDQAGFEELYIDNTLRASKLATFEVLTYDHDFLLSPLADLQFIARCSAVRPDAIILSSWGMAPRHPSINSFRFIRERLGIPVAALWWDTCSEAFWQFLPPYMKQFDVHVIMDNPALRFADKKDPLFHRVLPLWPLQDGNLFCPGATRDIPVSFSGQVSSYRSYRQETIDHLIDQEIPGHIKTDNSGRQASHAAYADLLRRSKLSINFSYSVSCHQLKGRVFDVMLSGAMLLESENDQISKLFTPMKDYVPFSSKEDLVEKIRHYLSNEQEAEKIAQQGRATTLTSYNSERFWEILLDKLDLTERP